MKNTITVLSLLPLLAVLSGCTGSHLPPSVKPNLANAEQIREKLAVAGDNTVEEETTIEWGGQFATLKGTITISGDAPANPTLKVDKDLTVCNPSGSPVVDRLVTVGANKGIANVLVYADVPTEWCHETMIGNTDTVDFDQKNCLFLNRIFPMQTSQKLRLLNSDTVGHNAALKPSRNPEYNPNIAGGGEALYPPEGVSLKQEKSPFGVSCAAHPWMQSYLIIRDNGYFSVTGENGAFELPNLPAGVPIKITVWHEASRGVSGKEVTADESIAQGWNKRGTFTVTLSPDNSETVLDVAINSTALAK